MINVAWVVSQCRDPCVAVVFNKQARSHTWHFAQLPQAECAHMTVPMHHPMLLSLPPPPLPHRRRLRRSRQRTGEVRRFLQEVFSPSVSSLRRTHGSHARNRGFASVTRRSPADGTISHAMITPAASTGGRKRTCSSFRLQGGNFRLQGGNFRLQGGNFRLQRELACRRLRMDRRLALWCSHMPTRRARAFAICSRAQSTRRCLSRCWDGSPRRRGESGCGTSSPR